MVARRRTKHTGQTEYERVKAMLDALPVSDEAPALFWGPDWKEKLQESLDDVAAGRVERFYSDEEFLAALERLHHECQHMTGRPDSGATSTP
jgi:hypothetical protein